MIKTKAAPKAKPKVATTQPKRQTAPAPAPKSRALATIPRHNKQVSTNVIDFAADSHMGMEGMGQADFAIPRLAIIQDLSPQRQKRDEKYIEGAEAGDICDTVGMRLFDGNEGILVVPVSYRRAYIEWVPRTKGGGFVQDRTPLNTEGAQALQDFLSKCDRGEKGQIITPNKNEIKVSGEYFVFLLGDDGDYSPFVLNMGGSQAKKSRRWNTMMNQYKIDYNGQKINPAMWYCVYRLTTVPESNDQGSWFGWSITNEAKLVDMPNGEQIYREAKEFRNQIAAGRVSVSQPVQDDVVPGAVETDDMPM